MESILAQPFSGTLKYFIQRWIQWLGDKRENFWDSLLRTSLIDTILMEAKFKGIRVDKIEMKGYKIWYI